MVSGVNEVKKHTKPSKTNQGGIVTKNLPLHISNVRFRLDRDEYSTNKRYNESN